VLAHFGHHLLTALPVPLLPLIRDDFALDYTRSALLVSAFSIPYGISQLPAGWLADRIGSRIMLALGICGVAIAGLLIGLSQTYVMLIMSLVLMGVLGGGYHPSASPLVSSLVRPDSRGKALGLHMVGGSASYFLAPLAGAALAAIWGWRSPFIILAVPVAAFGVVFYLLLGRWTRTDEVKYKPGERYKEPSTQGRLHHLIAFLILGTFIQAMVLSVIAFIPLFMVDHFGTSEKSAAALLALVYSSGLWAGLLGGYLSDHLGRIPVIVMASLAAGPAVYFLNKVSGGWTMCVLLVVLGMILYTRGPVAEAYLIGHTSEHNRSTVMGIYYFGNMEGSGMLTLLLGYLIDRSGFYSSFTIAGVAIILVTLLCSVWLRHNHD